LKFKTKYGKIKIAGRLGSLDGQSKEYPAYEGKTLDGRLSGVYSLCKGAVAFNSQTFNKQSQM